MGDDAPRIESRPRSGSPAPRCPFCREELEPADARRACPVCAVSHHEDCWAEAGRCAACVHRAAAPAAPPPAPLPGTTVSLRPRLAGPLITSPSQALAAAMALVLLIVGTAVSVARMVERRSRTPESVLEARWVHGQAPDLSHVRVGQRYTFQQSERLTTVLTVLWVTPRAVSYRSSTSRDGVAQGEDHDELWEWRPSEQRHGPLPRERRRFGEIELECVQRQVGGLRLWIAVTAGTDADERFPGAVESLREDGSVMSKLISIE
jgi:hypothetical protein